MRVLVVDDEAEVRDLLIRALGRDGHVVTSAADLDEATRSLAERPADVIVLDLGLGDHSGLELCRALRTAGEDVAILILTAQPGVARRVEGLDAGADDFLAKPFALAELRARVRALGRRRSSAAPRTLVVDGVTVDVAGRKALRGAVPVALTAREWTIVECLAARAGRVVARHVLLEEVWGESSEAAAASLEVLIGRIRRKLGANAITTLRGEGYSLAGRLP